MMTNTIHDQTMTKIMMRDDAHMNEVTVMIMTTPPLLFSVRPLA